MRELFLILTLLLSLSCTAAQVKLTAKNHYFLFTQVDQISTAIALSELRRLDKALPAGEPLYLVLRTPGGSVIAGMDFIRASLHLSRPITTITIQSMSMGFQIVQNLGRRLIVHDGIMMTHPIAGRCEGRVAEIVSCVNMMVQLALSLDVLAARRMSMSLTEYQRLSSEEWYTVGQKAIDVNMADAIVVIKCDEELNKRDRCPY